MKLNDFALERFFAKYEFAVKHLMCASDCESMTVRELLALDPSAADRLQDLRLGYAETLGHPELRLAIAQHLYVRTKPEHVLVFSGAQEPIFAFMNVMLGPGDEVVVHVPAYQSLYDVATAASAHVRKWEAREPDRWLLDPDDLPKLCSEKTRGIVINSPHNPTGALLPRDRFDAIVHFARERGLWLFSDEVYRGLEHDPSQQNPAACDVYERAISLGTTAKTYGLAGLRIGWLATHDAALLERLAAFKDWLTISNAGPSEVLATVAMRHHDEIAARNRAIVASNAKLFTAHLATHPEISWVPPTAGSIAFPKREGAEAWCATLLERHGIAFAPGRLFGGAPDHFRVGLGRKTFAEGLAKLTALS